MRRHKYLSPTSGTFLLILVSLLLLSSSVVVGLDVLIDRNFGMKRMCLAGYESYIFNLNGSPFSTTYGCQSECYQDTYSSKNPISMLPILGSSILGLGFQLQMSAFSQPYSYIQVDFTYKDPGSTGLGFAIYTSLSDPLGTPLYTSPTFTPSIGTLEDGPTVTCGSTSFNLLSISDKFSSSVLNNIDTLYFALSESTNTLGNAVFLRSMLITRNCVPNCVTCSSSTSCSACKDGFSKYTLNSGDSVCEVVGSACTRSNCKTCTGSGQEETCRVCQPGYHLDGWDCVSNGSASCSSSQYYEDGYCYEYSKLGYAESNRDGSYQPITQLTGSQIQQLYKCPFGKLAVVARPQSYTQYSCKCFIDGCSWCSNNSSCDLCKIGYTYNAATKSCVKGSYESNNFQINQLLIDSGYEIRLKFGQSLMYKALAASDLNVQISDFSQFSINTVSLEDDSTAFIKIDMHSYAKNRDITVEITNPTFKNANFLKKKEETTVLQAYLNVSDSEKEAAETAQSIGNIASGAIVGSLLPIVIISNFSAVVSTIDLTGFLYYLLYIDARFPINITAFYNVFKNFQLDFIPNPFTDMVTSGYTQLSAVKFLQTDTDAYFLTYSGQSVTIWIMIMAMYVFVKIMAQMDFAFISAYFKKSVYETWEYGGFFDAVWTVYIYLLIGVLLQFQSFDCSDTSCTWNYIIFGISFFVSFGLPMYIVKLLRNAPNLKEDVYMKTKLSSLIAGVRLFSQKEALLTPEERGEVDPDPSTTGSRCFSMTNVAPWREKYAKTWTKYYMPILYFRKIIFSLVIVCLNTFGYVQLTLITLLNVGMTLYFLLLRPLESNYENVKGAVSEIVMIVFQILVGILINDPESQEEQDRINIGWVAIALVSLVILWHTVGIIFDFIVSIYEAIKTVVLKGGSLRKVSPHDENNIGDNDDVRSNPKNTHIPLKQREIDESNFMPNNHEDESVNMSPMQSSRRKKFSEVSTVRSSMPILNNEKVDNKSDEQEKLSAEKQKRPSQLMVQPVTMSSNNQQRKSIINVMQTRANNRNPTNNIPTINEEKSIQLGEQSTQKDMSLPTQNFTKYPSNELLNSPLRRKR